MTISDKRTEVRLNTIVFVCPCCEASHARGFVDGVSLFRCLHCGYVGHGFHPDPEIDRQVFEDHRDGNAMNARLGLPMTPLGVDPLSFGC